MSQIKSILVITSSYYPFVKNLCDEFARKGYSVTVIAPQSITSRIRHKRSLSPVESRYTVGDNEVKVCHPYNISFSSNHPKINNYITRICINRYLRKHHIKPDVCYGHFWRNGYYAVPFVKANKIPLFVATGEGDLRKYAPILTSVGYVEMNKYLNGVISVSSNNRSISKELGLLDGKDCLVAPNAIDNKLFYKKDRSILRQRHGFGQDDFIVAFVGAFNNRKGPQRVSAAIEKVRDVKSFFIGGQGESELLEPNCEGILFKGRLPHDTIPDYLNMADVFVLPTLNEGCCNAVVEALACGLPVVSSNRSFNYDVLNDTNSIMVDPTNVDEIAAAIKELKENKERRQQLEKGALKTAEELTIDQRAEKILLFMEQHI